MSRKKEDPKQEYEYSLTKPVEESFSQDEIDVLAAEAGAPLDQCECSLTASEDGKEHTYTVTPNPTAEKPVE